MPRASSRRNCSPMALQTDISPECSRATSSPASCARTYSASIASRSIGAVLITRASGGHNAMIPGRDQRAGIETDRAARHEIAPAHGDEIRCARPGPDEMHAHGKSFCDRMRERDRRRGHPVGADHAGHDEPGFAPWRVLRRCGECCRSRTGSRRRAGG